LSEDGQMMRVLRGISAKDVRDSKGKNMDVENNEPVS